MRQQIKIVFTSMILMSVVVAQAFAQSPSQATAPPAHVPSLTGRWRVKFAFNGNAERNLIFDSQPKGVGFVLLLDTGPDNKPVESPLPALWSQTSNDRVNFSSEVELPFGTCCREIGTLILKGKFDSGNSIKGRAIFIASTEEEENLIGYRSMFGTFTATRELR